MSKYRVTSCLAGFVVLASGVAVLAQGEGLWRLASPESLLAATGGAGNCNVKCANPNVCPGGDPFDCGSITCPGSGACGTANGTNNNTSKYCPACDMALNGKADCTRSFTLYCAYTITCGNCVPPNMYGGYWYCSTSGQTGNGLSHDDMIASGAACQPGG